MSKECSFCGEVTSNLEEHHPNSLVDKQSTIPLCNRCHQTYLKPLAHKVANAGPKTDWRTDGLAYCEIGGHFTNLTFRVRVRDGYCMDAPFCWADQCDYNLDLDAEKTKEISRKITESFFSVFVDGEESTNTRLGEMALTDDDGKYWFEREDIVNRLIDLIDDEVERERFRTWYESIDSTIEKQGRVKDF